MVRYNALSRNIESALQKDSIPNRIVGGHKFFERMEIKDLLAYLQLAENSGFTVRHHPLVSVTQLIYQAQPAFVRVVNVPRRAIGDKVSWFLARETNVLNVEQSVADVLAAAKSMNISPMELAERIIDGDKLPEGIKPALKRNLASFVGVVRKLRRAAERVSSSSGFRHYN